LTPEREKRRLARPTVERSREGEQKKKKPTTSAALLNCLAEEHRQRRERRKWGLKRPDRIAAAEKALTSRGPSTHEYMVATRKKKRPGGRGLMSTSSEAEGKKKKKEGKKDAKALRPQAARRSNRPEGLTRGGEFKPLGGRNGNEGQKHPDIPIRGVQTHRS